MWQSMVIGHLWYKWSSNLSILSSLYGLKRSAADQIKIIWFLVGCLFKGLGEPDKKSKHINILKKRCSDTDFGKLGGKKLKTILQLIICSENQGNFPYTIWSLAIEGGGYLYLFNFFLMAKKCQTHWQCDPRPFLYRANLFLE